MSKRMKRIGCRAEAAAAKKKRRKTEIMRTRNSTLLCHLAWLNIKWFSWWWTQNESSRNSNVQPLKFRSRVIWYKRVRWLQPFYNVISVIYNIYVRPFGNFFLLFFLLLFVLCFGKMFRGVWNFFLNFYFAAEKNWIFRIQCVFFLYSHCSANDRCAGCWRESNILTVSADTSFQR